MAFIGATEETDARGGERRSGAIETARELGLPEAELFTAGKAPVSMRHGARCLQDIQPRLGDFDALICVSDTVAFGALSECKRLGVSVPDDLAITGFGYFDVAAVSEPNITTVDVSANRIGREVAKVLQGLFEGRPAPNRIDVGVRLVKGGTT